MQHLEVSGRLNPRGKLTYRPDIDGLRFVAVTSVVLNHAFPSIFYGGFIGVDIFYVISGYLITHIILEQLAGNRFRLVDFYARRVRRIIPALAVMLIATTAFAMIFLPPHKLAEYGHSLRATALFFSNIYFWKTAGYFTPEAHAIPLLHTWSLAIEEQYYIFFPLVLLLIWRTKFTKIALIIGFLASFAVSVTLVRNHAYAAFYLLPSRAWELLIGAVVAARIIPVISNRIALEVAALVGFLLLAAGFVVTNSSSVFPGEMALFPCLGAATLIYAGVGLIPTGISRFLSFRPFVFVGTISYSLYLWHWPVISFLHYRFDEFTPAIGIAAVVLSAVLAIISWWFVERRFHASPSNDEAPKRRMGNAAVLAISICTLVIFAGVGSGLIRLESQTFVEAMYPADIATLNKAAARLVTPDSCRGSDATLTRSDCRIGTLGRPATAALWGDSYASALRNGLPSILINRSAYGFILHSCPPILGVLRVDERPEYRNFGPQCINFNIDTSSALVARPEIDTVILFGSYRLAYDIPGTPTMLVPEGDELARGEKRLESITDRIIDTATLLKKAGKTVVLIGTFYSTERLGAIHLLQRRMFGLGTITQMDVATYDKYSKRMNDRLRGIVDDSILFLDPKPLFCKEGARFCEFNPDGVPVLTDGTHISVDGAERLSRLISETLDAAHKKQL